MFCKKDFQNTTSARLLTKTCKEVSERHLKRLQENQPTQPTGKDRIEQLQEVVSNLGFIIPLEDKDAVYERYLTQVDTLNATLAETYRYNEEISTKIDAVDNISNFSKIFHK